MEAYTWTLSMKPKRRPRRPAGKSSTETKVVEMKVTSRLLLFINSFTPSLSSSLPKQFPAQDPLCRSEANLLMVRKAEGL